MKYRPEIDGLRALAVVPVILFHAGLPSFGGGYVGVDIFFVISGYLITTIIIDEIDAGRFSILRFYERRARRILPALFAVMLVCIPFAWAWLLPRDLVDFAESLIAVSTFWSNILFWLESGYFNPTAELKPLLHTWSLAVEEQFYIFFPPCLVLLWGLGRHRVLALLGLVFLASLSLAHWGSIHKPTSTFYLLPTRGWELLLGSFTAFYLQRKSPPGGAAVHQGASLLGFACILYAIFVFDEQTPFPSLFALVPTLGSVLIILFAVQGTVVFRLLSTQVCVGLGLISYSAYLWHQPLFAFTKYRSFEEPGPVVMLALCGVTLGLAYLSWRYIEQPFRKPPARAGAAAGARAGGFGQRAIFSASLAGIAGFIAVGVFFQQAQGFPNRALMAQLDQLSYEPDNSYLRYESWIPLRALTGDDDYDAVGNDADWDNWFDLAAPQKRVLVIGNSHSKDIFNVLSHSETATEQFQFARFGWQIRAMREDFFTLPNYLNADVIMIATRYEKGDLVQDFGWFVERVLADGKTMVFVRNIYEFQSFGWKTTADMLITRALLFEDGLTDEMVGDINRAYYEEYSTVEKGAAVQLADRRIDALKRRYPSIVVLDRMGYVCDDLEETCFAVDTELNKFFYDYGHHTLQGARFFGARVDEIGWLSELIEAVAD